MGHLAPALWRPWSMTMLTSDCGDGIPLTIETLIERIGWGIVAVLIDYMFKAMAYCLLIIRRISKSSLNYDANAGHMSDRPHGSQFAAVFSTVYLIY